MFGTVALQSYDNPTHEIGTITQIHRHCEVMGHGEDTNEELQLLSFKVRTCSSLEILIRGPLQVVMIEYLIEE